MASFEMTDSEIPPENLPSHSSSKKKKKKSDNSIFWLKKAGGLFIVLCVTILTISVKRFINTYKYVTTVEDVKFVTRWMAQSAVKKIKSEPPKKSFFNRTIEIKNMSLFKYLVITTMNDILDRLTYGIFPALIVLFEESKNAILANREYNLNRLPTIVIISLLLLIGTFYMFYNKIDQSKKSNKSTKYKKRYNKYLTYLYQFTIISIILYVFIV